MRHLSEMISKPCYWAILVILVYHWQCTAGTVDKQQTETLEQCSFKNSDAACSVHTDNREAYTESQNQQAPGGAIEHNEEDYQDFIIRSMERLEGMLEESRDQVLEKLRKVMDKMAHSRDRMIKKLDSLLDTVSHSRLVTEIDHLLDEVSHSKIIEDMKSLPRELKESLLLSVRNRSYVAAGIMVIVTMAVLVGGSLYFAWCHHDGWSITYDYKALAMGVSAVAAVTGANKDQHDSQVDKEELPAIRKENIGAGEKHLGSQKPNKEEKSRDMGVSNGFGRSSKDTDGSVDMDSLTSDCQKSEDNHASNGQSVTCNAVEERMGSENICEHQSNSIGHDKVACEVKTNGERKG